MEGVTLGVENTFHPNSKYVIPCPNTEHQLRLFFWILSVDKNSLAHQQCNRMKHWSNAHAILTVIVLSFSQGAVDDSEDRVRVGESQHRIKLRHLRENHPLRLRSSVSTLRYKNRQRRLCSSVSTLRYKNRPPHLRSSVSTLRYKNRQPPLKPLTSPLFQCNYVTIQKPSTSPLF